MAKERKGARRLSLADLNRERFQEEVARELGLEVSPADRVDPRLPPSQQDRRQ
ncbi:protein of unknown function [Candidatus Hydrogenisulfobacillus filiaventi]|uniref:Uncharacterized protein n=1 Tax=Candidatus Hydrogenisulfobacillus filiaventi TaxID=2707344 RepID=A0A6F8ZJM0_9FIRM|nr:hypothetical protein [Bacillota bacterium]CAB1129790.1 protein of unknown function [Candidatus Hydrogenisulfobacillus filiaventi]